jgi:hypothetical protein
LSKKKRESGLLVRPEKNSTTYNDKNMNKSILDTATNH